MDTFEGISWHQAKEAFRTVLREEMGTQRLSLARKWDGGKVLLVPCDENQKAKEIPMEAFFKKITSVREKLRVLEQKINHSESLSLEERTEFQQYITRAYGSLTTFNVLFQEEDDKFTGAKSE